MELKFEKKIEEKHRREKTKEREKKILFM